MFNDLQQTPEAVIKVVGIGGAGGNALNAMVRSGIQNVGFLAVNTDAQALKNSEADTVLQIGIETTKGYGCGTDPQSGYNSALESKDTIRENLLGTDMLFIAAGMGGGTGTGAAPVIAQVAKELGILTVAVVTKPFSFEGNRRARAADMGILHLRESVDSLIVIENMKLATVLPSGTPMMKAFAEADNVLCNAVSAIAKVITTSGLVNVDFADVVTVMKCTGRALMGSGEGSGENRAEIAADKAIHSPLLENFEMKAAKGILCTITHGTDFSIEELTTVGAKVQSLASPDATIVIGTIPDHDLDDKCIVTVIATGIDADSPMISEQAAFDSEQRNLSKEQVRMPSQSQAKPQTSSTLSRPAQVVTNKPVAATYPSNQNSVQNKPVLVDDSVASEVALASELSIVPEPREQARAESMAQTKTSESKGFSIPEFLRRSS